MSLVFLGEALPSDSFVDFDDVLNIGGGPGPSNRNHAFEDRALQCITGGRFRCELPSAANPSVNQIIYVSICEFVAQIVCTHIIVIILLFLQ